jgi:hypothetical protein
MSKQDDIFDKRGADSISDAAIRRSLLGCADPGEQASFEAALMLDDQFAKRVYRLEFELADDFTFERLIEREQQLFTSNFLVTRHRAGELAVSQALRRAVSEKSAWAGRTNLSWRSKVLNLFAFDRPFARVALAASALLFFATLFWLVLKAPAVRPPLIAKRQPVNSEKEYAHAVGSQSPEDKAQPHVVVSITLQPDSQSGIKAPVHLSNPTSEFERVRLELLIAGAAAPTYQVNLMSNSGAEITSSTQLVPELTNPPKVVLDVPANLLSTGNYYIDLKRTSEGQADAVQRYGFQVKKE